MSPAALTAQLVPPQTQTPLPAAVLVARAGLEALTARLGQTLSGTVAGTDAQGLTRLTIGGDALTVRLSQPLPPGTAVQVTLVPTPNGPPVLAVQPRPGPLPVPVPLSLPPGAQLILPAPAAQAAGAGVPPSAIATVLPSMTSTGRGPVPPPASLTGPVVATVQPSAPATTTTTTPALPPGTAAGPRAIPPPPTGAPPLAATPSTDPSAATLPRPAGQPIPAPATATRAGPTGPGQPAPAPATLAGSSRPTIPVPAPHQSVPGPVGAAQAPRTAAPVLAAPASTPTAPPPGVAQTISPSGPGPALPAASTPVSALPVASAPPVTANPGVALPPGQPAAQPVPGFVASPGPASMGSAASAPAGAPAQPTPLAGTAQPAGLPAATAAPASPPAPAPVSPPAAAPGAAVSGTGPGTPVPHPPQPSGAPAATLYRDAAGQSDARPAPGGAARIAPAPQPVAPARTNVPAPAAAPAAAGTAAATKPSAQLSIAHPAQAAARQDSVAPLLQNLGALQGKLAQLPGPIAEAAGRLLASRLPLDRGTPGATTIRAAVARSGVFASAPARPGAALQPDMRSALLQLRSGLLGLLDGGEITPVAPVTRRPPPPMRDAQPRALRADAPTLPETASARDAVRTLLSQTDGALARLKLAQVASQPPDAARAAALPTSDFIVELPMLLGHELSMAQLSVQRDGQGKDKRGARGWRVRFAVSFSVIGEVGAQVSLLGKSASIALWAVEETTALVLEDMLPELRPALEARGLEVGALRVRRGPPAPDSMPSSGRLMDQRR